MIDDDAIPALITFKKLKHLGVDGTSIGIEGLRRFAGEIHYKDRKIRIEIPRYLQYYLDRMSPHSFSASIHNSPFPIITDLHHEYLLTIPAPFITSPGDIDRLQLVDLRKNLAAHSRVNRGISTTGNKREMGERLRNLLVRRHGDLRVKKMWEEGWALGLSESGAGGEEAVADKSDVKEGSGEEDEF
jgi:hypothetical protein